MPDFLSRNRGLTALIAVLLAAGATACGSSDGGGGTVNGAGGGSTSASTGPSGGTLVVGAEQEPDCADWIAVCAGNIWGSYTMQVTTLPTAFDTRKQDGRWALVPSDVLAGEPTVEVRGGKQTITYRIAPEAVWSDGTPISSRDFAYTALQIRDGEGIFDKTGYDLIEDVEMPDEKTAVVKLRTTFGPWRSLFGGSYSILPEHLLRGKDRAKIMKDGYSFSGGPWKIEKWQKGNSVTLVPNDRYWGDKPKLDKVVFQFIPDTSAAFQALKSGQVQSLYPTPQVDAISQIKAGIPNTRVEVDAETGNLEALWMNNGRFPLDDEAVRKALAYAVDRKAIVERLYGPLGVSDPEQSFVTPLVGAFAGSDFDVYEPDPARVEQLMTGAGWSRGGDGIWAKDGRKAEMTITSLAGNKRRELTEQILQQQLREAGFALKITNTTPAEIFSKLAPAGDFQLGLWTLIDQYPEPALSASFSSTSIPTKANGNSGINFYRANIPGLDAELRTVDTSTDQATRRAASLRADALIAAAVPSLPIATVPNVLMTNDAIGGPTSINPSEGPWWNLEEWTRGQ